LPLPRSLCYRELRNLGRRMENLQAGDLQIHRISPDQGHSNRGVFHDRQELLFDIALRSRAASWIQSKRANRGSALRGGDQVGPTTSVHFGKSKANTDEPGDRRAIPLRLPTRRLIWRGRTPICEIQALDAANQLGFDGLRLRRVCQLVSVRAPAQHDTSLAKFERNIRKTGCAQPRRQIASEY